MYSGGAGNGKLAGMEEIIYNNTNKLYVLRRCRQW